MREIVYSITIPVYNSGKWIEELICQIEKTMESLGERYEIVLVNDCSPDLETWSRMRCLPDTHMNIKVIDLQYNVGQWNALLCGIKHSEGKYIITMDDDLQHSPTDIPKLIDKIRNSGCDCVIANYKHKEHNIIRKLGSRFVNYLLCKIYNKPKNITSNSFRIMTRDLGQVLTSYRGKYPRIGTMIFTITKKIETVEIEHKKRSYGKSGYSLLRLISTTLDTIIYGSTIPLDIIGIGGGMISILSFLIGIIYMILYLLGKVKVPGFTAQILVTTFFFGVVILSMGVIGKYLGQIMKESIGFPAYMVKEIKSGSGLEEK